MKKDIDNRIIVWAVLFCGLILSGCDRKNPPDGMPELFPVTVTITQDGGPLADAAVELVPDDENLWGAGGRTNGSGKATIHTRGVYSGASPGTYKVYVTKKETVEIPGGNGSTEDWSFVELDYASPTKTPLSLQVGSNGAKASFDVGKKVRLLMPPF